MPKSNKTMIYIIAGIICFGILLTIRHFFGFEVAILYGLITFNIDVIRCFKEREII